MAGDVPAKREAIRNEGQRAERRFIEIVTGARPSNAARRGDVTVTVDGKDEYVEVKECHANCGQAGTINQVRAIKYISCVIWAPKRGSWYVMSPDQLVRLSATKERGQHTEIPFECMSFSLKSLPDGLHVACNDEQLTETVHDAVRRGREKSKLQRLMCELLSDIESVREHYRKLVEAE